MIEVVAELTQKVGRMERLLERSAVIEAVGPGGGSAPANAQYVVLALDGTLSQERVLTGTANQVIITDNGAGSTVVLSLPQDIGLGASVNFSDITVTNVVTDAIQVLDLTAGRVVYVGASDFLVDSANFTYDGTTLTVAVSNATTTPAITITQASTGDAALRWALGSSISYAFGIDNSISGDLLVLSYAASGSAVLGTGDIVYFDGANVRVGVNTSAPTHKFSVASNVSAGRGLVFEQYSADALNGVALWRKSRNATIGSHTTVQNGDGLLNLSAQGSDGSSFVVNAASLQAFVDGTVSAGVTPGRMEISTMDSGGTLTRRWSVKPSGNMLVSVNTSEPSGGGTPVIVIDQASGNPTGMPSNTAGLFAKDVAGTCELFGVDEGGAVNQLTAHALDGPAAMRWERGLLADLIHRDENVYTGGVRWTNLTLLAAFCEWAAAELRQMGRAVPAEFGQFQHEEKQPGPVQDWDANQAALVAQRQAEIAFWKSLSKDERLERGPQPQPITVKARPAWMGRALGRAAQLPAGPVDVRR